MLPRADGREKDYEHLINLKKLELGDKDHEIATVKAKVEEKQQEIAEQAKKLLKMKDAAMDFEAKLEKKQETEKHLREDAVGLQEQLAGKDQAISALGQSLITKAQEHEKL